MTEDLPTVSDGAGVQRVVLSRAPDALGETPRKWIDIAERDISRWVLARRFLTQRQHRADFGFGRFSYESCSELTAPLRFRRRRTRIWGSAMRRLERTIRNAPRDSPLAGFQRGHLLDRRPSLPTLHLGAVTPECVRLRYVGQPSHLAFRGPPDISVVGVHKFQRWRAPAHRVGSNRGSNETRALPQFAILLAIQVLYGIFVLASVVLYCAARVFWSLVVECFMNLVHLPDSAFLLPQWSQYVPHSS